MRASVANVVMSIVLMVFLVVVRHDGARGLLAGNYTASARRCCSACGGSSAAGCWRRCARASPDAAAAAGDARASGCRPSPPTRASTRCRSSTAGICCARSQPARGGLYALAAKLATVVFVAVRGFQYAWPPLAYSVDRRRRRGAAVRAGHDLLRARDRRSSSRASRCSAAGRCGCCSHQLLRRARRAAVARARLGALRPVPDLRRDLRPRAPHAPQPAGGAGRARGQRRRPVRARAAARHRRRRHRARDRLHGDDRS